MQVPKSLGWWFFHAGFGAWMISSPLSSKTAGQALSVRPDVLPEAFLQEFREFQDGFSTDWQRYGCHGTYEFINVSEVNTHKSQLFWCELQGYVWF